MYPSGEFLHIYMRQVRVSYLLNGADNGRLVSSICPWVSIIIPKTILILITLINYSTKQIINKYSTLLFHNIEISCISKSNPAPARTVWENKILMKSQTREERLKQKIWMLILLSRDWCSRNECRTIKTRFSDCVLKEKE